MQKTRNISVYLAADILILAFAIFAPYFGLDTDRGWGKGRIALLLLGLLIGCIPWIRSKLSDTPEQSAKSDLFLFPVLLIVLGVYFWFITVSHDSTSNYYSLLATSFRSGELSLPLKPNPALLALPNPYDPAAREGSKTPLDLSLYNGKFYLYWGPAPSLLLAVLQSFLPGKMSEADLLFLFMSGIFLVQYALLLYIWDRFFPTLPKWILILSVLLAGFAHPALWLLSQPKIYEAAIAGAQFFFIAGFLAAVQALDRAIPSRWRLALAGICWALAAGTRSVAALPVVFMTLMVVYLLFKMHRQSSIQLIGDLISLGMPLLIGALGFAWYNWARFGSFIETGFTYQLAGPYLQKHLKELFLPAYIFQNLYNYVLNPLTIKEPFPFLYAIRGRIDNILPGQALPELYTAQAVTGFLYAVPFVVFAILPVITLVKKILRKSHTEDSNQYPSILTLNWMITCLLGSFLLPFLSLLAFFWAAMRYSEDFMPALTLLSIIGFWQGYSMPAPHTNQRRIYAAFGGLLAGLSIVAAFLLALSIYYTNGLLKPW